MLKKKLNNEGYILLEANISLVIIGVLITDLLLFYVEIRKQEIYAKLNLERSRFLYEASEIYRTTGEFKEQSKNINGKKLIVNGWEKGSENYLAVQMGDQKFEVFSLEK